jgi:predicted GTPase
MSNPFDADLTNIIHEKVMEAFRQRGHANVIVAGKTGVGKSTLINAVFQGDIATTGQGRPVTQDTREYTKEGVPISIFDTRGLELEAFDETLRQLTALVDQRSQETDPSRTHSLCLALHIRRRSKGGSRRAKSCKATCLTYAGDCGDHQEQP